MKNVVICADRTGDQIQAMGKHWESRRCPISRRLTACLGIACLVNLNAGGWEEAARS